MAGVQCPVQAGAALDLLADLLASAPSGRLYKAVVETKLAAAIGATTSRHDDGSYTAPYEMARALTLFAAHGANTAAIT